MAKNKKLIKPSKKRKKRGVSLKFPASLLAPIGTLLSKSLKKLEKRKADINTEDPFKDQSRILDNASPDTDAAEQFGHARTSAIKERLERKIIQTKKAMTRVKIGKYGICEDCGEMINTDRLMIYPEATICVSCEKKKEK